MKKLKEQIMKMNEIVLEDREGSSIAVSVKNYDKDSESSNFLGDITLAFELNNSLSPEKTGQLDANDKAIYGASLSCGVNCLALGKNFENSSAGINVISLIKNSYASSNSCSENLVNLSAFDLCFLTSSSKNSGAINSNLFNIEFIENTEEKNKKGSNRVTEPNWLTPNYDNFNKSKYLNVSEKNTEEKKSLNLVEHPFLRIDNVALMVMHKVLAKLNNNESNNYINFSEEKNKEGKNVTLMVRNSSQEFNNYNDNNYISFSVNDDNAEEAALTLMVRDRPHKSDLLPRRQPGSTPGRGASAFDFSKIKND